MSDYFEFKNDIDNHFNAPKYRVWKYSALGVIGLAVAAQIAVIIWIHEIPYSAKLFIQGFVGVCAIVFIILMGILSYKVYSDYTHSK